jgi:hypothetical protein
MDTMPDPMHERAFYNRTHMADEFPKSYYTSKITDTLNEWNESELFELDPVVVQHTEQGVTVSGVMWHSTEYFNERRTDFPIGAFMGYKDRTLDGQFIAVYGDDDELAFLGILTNPGISVLIDHTIRG